MRNAFFLIAMVLMSYAADAQSIQCVDSNRIDPWFQCNDPDFSPVCGCNHKTYRNECVAFRNNGVNYNDYDGVCQEDYFYWEIYPNVADFSIKFFLQFYESGNITIEIRDSYGKLMYQLNDGPLFIMQTTLDVAGYRPGVYFVMVYSRSSGKYEYKRFIKIG